MGSLRHEARQVSRCDPKGGAVSTSSQIVNFTSSPPAANVCWYAAQTRSRHERLVAHHLEVRGIVQYVPTIAEVHKWSDRRKKIELPLFPGYVFVQIIASNEFRVKVLHIPGVVRLVGSEPSGTQIPDDQIQSVKTLVERKLAWTSHPFLKAGQKVRVRGGALDGIEGIFVKRSGLDTLVISIDAIQRSLSVSVQGYQLQAL
jgi:transcription antitermination factor NusG